MWVKMIVSHGSFAPPKTKDKWFMPAEHFSSLCEAILDDIDCRLIVFSVPSCVFIFRK